MPKTTISCLIRCVTGSNTGFINLFAVKSATEINPPAILISPRSLSAGYPCLNTFGRYCVVTGDEGGRTYRRLGLAQQSSIEVFADTLELNRRMPVDHLARPNRFDDRYDQLPQE